MNKNIHRHVNTRKSNSMGRSRTGSFGNAASGGGKSEGRNCSRGSLKMEMSAEEREELERVLNRPITVPAGVLETRPYDYKKKICHILKHTFTEEDELYHEQGGRNPLFTTMKEDARRRILLRDDHLMQICQVINGDESKVNDSESSPLDPTDTAITQHIQHELETLRIQRSDPANLGCSCRKLHVFLPGSIDKSHHKKKGSHRRMPERKVCEELRRRGLLNKCNENMSRENMEILLHDTIEKEPCCWSNDCPCVNSSIGCQADTCSCWHASHVVAHGGDANSLSNVSSRQEVEVMESRCGNIHGMYIVNFEEIAKYRKQFVTTDVIVKT